MYVCNDEHIVALRTATSNTPPSQLQIARELLASLGEQIEVADEGRLYVCMYVVYVYVYGEQLLCTGACTTYIHLNVCN